MISTSNSLKSISNIPTVINSGSNSSNNTLNCNSNSATIINVSPSNNNSNSNTSISSTCNILSNMTSISNTSLIYNPYLSSNLQSLSNYSNIMLIREGDVISQHIKNNKTSTEILISGTIFSSNESYLKNLGMKVEYINYPCDVTRISWPK